MVETKPFHVSIWTLKISSIAHGRPSWEWMMIEKNTLFRIFSPHLIKYLHLLHIWNGRDNSLLFIHHSKPSPFWWGLKQNTLLKFSILFMFVEDYHQTSIPWSNYFVSLHYQLQQGAICTQFCRLSSGLIPDFLSIVEFLDQLLFVAFYLRKKKKVCPSQYQNNK